MSDRIDPEYLCSNKRTHIIGYQIIGPLGSGSYGHVYLVKDKNEKQYAIKQIPIKQQQSKAIQKIQKETNLAKNCGNNKNIVRYYETFREGKDFYIVMEYCNGGNLHNYLSKMGNTFMPQIKARKILIDILHGMRTLVEQNAVHRDIKLQNLLIKVAEDRRYSIVIADFGQGKYIDGNPAKTFVGTQYTMAPQVLNNQPYGNKCDIWSVGIVYYYLLYKKSPFHKYLRLQKPQNVLQYQEYIKQIKQNPQIDFSQREISQDSKQFIIKCLKLDHKQRMSWQQMERDPLIMRFPDQQKQLDFSMQLDHPKIKQFYIRSCSFLNINYPIYQTDFQIAKTSPTKQSSKLYKLYQKILMSINMYILMKVDFATTFLDFFQNQPQITEVLKERKKTCIYCKVVQCIILEQILLQSKIIFTKMKKKQNLFKFSKWISFLDQNKNYEKFIKLFQQPYQAIQKKHSQIRLGLPLKYRQNLPQIVNDQNKEAVNKLKRYYLYSLCTRMMQVMQIQNQEKKVDQLTKTIKTTHFLLDFMQKKYHVYKTFQTINEDRKDFGKMYSDINIRLNSIRGSVDKLIQQKKNK